MAKNQPPLPMFTDALTQTHLVQRGPALAVDASAITLPIAILFANINPILTGISTCLAIFWFGVLIYNWIKGKDSK